MTFQPPPIEGSEPPVEGAITFRQNEDGTYDQTIRHTKEDMLRAASEALKHKRETLKKAMLESATPDRMTEIMEMFFETATGKDAAGKALAAPREKVAAGAKYLEYTVGAPERSDKLEVEFAYSPQELREQALAIAQLDMNPIERPAIGIAAEEELEAEIEVNQEDANAAVNQIE